MAASSTQESFHDWNWQDPHSVKGIADNVSLENSNEFYRKHSVAAGSISRVPTYHKDKSAQYVLPNDFPEHIRLAAQAVHLSALVKGRVFHAPLDASKAYRMLDVGCGTGIVTNLMFDEYPKAECFGLDISPVPNIHTHSPHVHFMQGNVISQKPTQWVDSETQEAEGVAFNKDESLFDYIFSRMQILGIYNWPTFIKSEFALLKPGGWAEVQDIDWEYLDGDGKNISDDWEWSRTLETVWEKRGLDMRCGSKAKDWMADAGFQDIQTFHYYWPFNADAGSSKEKIALANFTAAMMPEMLHHTFDLALEGKASDEEIQKLKEDMRRDNALAPGRYKPYTVTIGRKPL